MRAFAIVIAILAWTGARTFAAEISPVVAVEGQPLAANIERLIQALDFLGAPLSVQTQTELKTAAAARAATRLQQLLDPHILFIVDLNPEGRVTVARGPAEAVLQQGGYTPVLIKVLNESTTTKPLGVTSQQAGPAYAGVAKLSMERQRQELLRVNENVAGRTDRFLELEMFASPPMTAALSGLRVEYALALIYCGEAGKREATIAFNVGEGTQDLGFRGETPVLFDVRPAIQVKLSVKDFDGQPTTGRLLFLDHSGHVFPPQAKRVAPDLFFQKQIYRADGGTVTLPPGEFTMFYGRGPEYRWLQRQITVPQRGECEIAVRLERWINPMAHGFYGGDHHVHAAGCAHYTSPSEGVRPEDVLAQIKGEGLNVGCVLTWGYCFDFQKQFFAPGTHPLSEPFTQLKYDMEVSGFGSAALGHVCLLNLHELVYPGADGVKGWPTWTVPALRWTKAQGGFTGYAHSGSGLQIDPPVAANRIVTELDADRDGQVSRDEAASQMVPEPFEAIDSDHDHFLSKSELTASINRVADRLPNLAIPELNSSGAQEIFVSAAEGVCDFISAMDTARLLEWNCWYHLLNCGFPLKVSGETDFPCMSSTRVGQGRTYVQLGPVERIDFVKWCEGLAAGLSYVSDGYAHALAFSVNGRSLGEQVDLGQPGKVTVRAKVAFSSETPLEVAYGGAMPMGGMRLVGDTVVFHETASGNPFAGRMRKVELSVNGQSVASREVPADDQLHEVSFDVEIARSSWVAVRHFPQLHTNPINVIVGGQPIRASRQSALWCIGCIDQLWRGRAKNIAEGERAEAQKTYARAKERYRQIASEAPEDR